MGKILFFPMLTYGHINVCVSISRKLIEKNNQHEIYFLVDEEYETKLKKISDKIKYVKYVNSMFEEKSIPKMFQEFGKTWQIEDRVDFVKKSGHELIKYFDLLKKLYPTVTKIIQEIKPDFIIYDQLFTTPIGIDQGIPYAYLLSASPPYFGHHQYPPPQSDLPSEYTPENIILWEKFCNEAYRSGDFKIVHDKVNNWLKLKNCPNLDNKYFFITESPYLNIYNYPSQLDYATDKVKLPGKWVRMDTAVLKPYPEPFPIPEKLKNLPGELIYFSLGSMSSAYKPLMERLLNLLGQIPHRFIISLGVLGNEYKLSPNIYGENFINQLAVLQTVKLIISHGGNNTLTECFHFGVPLVVLPLYGDQINNSVRVVEKNFGCSLKPFKCTLEELKDAIEFCLKDDIQEKLKKISQQNHLDNGLDNVCEEILKFLKD